MRAGERRKNGVKIKLQQQPFQILTLLLRHPGEIVTREELRRDLWPDDTFVDFDHSLNTAIARLRDALGESTDRPVFVETLARRGHRFNAPLLASSPSLSGTGSGQVTSSVKSAFSIARIAAAITLAAAVLAASALTWVFVSHRHPAGVSRVQSIAVLPFENLSHDPGQEYFSDGMTSAIISNVSTLRPLRVISRTSTERYKGTRKSLPEIAKELNVDGVIEGSVLRAGDRVRIDVELFDAATDRQLWSQSYERPMGDVMRLHGEIAQAIADKVQVRLAEGQPKPVMELRSPPTVNQAAYEDYLKARGLWSTAGANPQLRMAQQYFERSIQDDPDFAPSYVGLADTYLTLGMPRRLSPQEARRKGREYLDRAFQLAPLLGEAHA